MLMKLPKLLNYLKLLILVDLLLQKGILKIGKLCYKYKVVNNCLIFFVVTGVLILEVQKYVRKQKIAFLEGGWVDLINIFFKGLINKVQKEWLKLVSDTVQVCCV